jgi:hypothetical protein
VEHVVYDDDAFAADREALLDAAARAVYEERRRMVCMYVCLHVCLYVLRAEVWCVIVHDDDALAAGREALLDAAARAVHEERRRLVCMYACVFVCTQS